MYAKGEGEGKRAGDACFLSPFVISSEGYNLFQAIDPECTLGRDPTGNIIGQAPRLSPLADNGGPTLTHALQPDSPAIDQSKRSDVAAPREKGHSSYAIPGTSFSLG